MGARPGYAHSPDGRNSPRWRKCVCVGAGAFLVLLAIYLFAPLVPSPLSWFVSTLVSRDPVFRPRRPRASILTSTKPRTPTTRRDRTVYWVETLVRLLKPKDPTGVRPIPDDIRWEGVWVWSTGKRKTRDSVLLWVRTTKGPRGEERTEWTPREKTCVTVEWVVLGSLGYPLGRSSLSAYSSPSTPIGKGGEYSGENFWEKRSRLGRGGGRRKRVREENDGTTQGPFLP